jgi:aryl-alcohol dehydrogenase-like predicted oxidoreductase
MNLSENPSFPLGFGTSKLRSLNGGLSGRAAQRLLENAFDLGIRFFDTAPSYGQGQAETAIGRLPRHLKVESIICSKVGYSYGRKAAVINTLKPLLRPGHRSLALLKRLAQKSREEFQRHGIISVNIQPAVIRKGLEGSLRRLRRDYLDVFLLHDASLASLNDGNRAELDTLQRVGKIRHWGISTGDAAVARRAIDLENIAVLQVPTEATFVNEAGDLFDKCAERGIAVVANRVLSPLRSSSTPSPLREDDPEQVIERCFAFALGQPGVRVVLCGTTSPPHLVANVRAMRHLLSSAHPPK